MALYVPATAVKKIDHLTGDVTITDALSPASLSYGDSFSIGGTIKSTKNKLDKVTVSMYQGTDLTKRPVLTSSATVSNNTYSLAGSSIDNALTFGSLAAGVYTYTVTAQAVSYYINTSGALATSTQKVLLEQQQCVITNWQDPNKDLAFGIDVSKWNGDINWAQVATAVDYAILRIGFEETLDERFLENAQGCEDNDIPYGVYLYSYAETQAEAVGEANFVIDTLKAHGLHPELPIWFDMEDEVHTVLSSTVKNQVVRGFCDTIEAAGLQPGLYTFISWFNSHFSSSYYDSLPKWVAQIDNFSANGTSTFDGGTWMWQYSWKGSIPGISGDVDCNYYYAELPGRWTGDTSYLTKCTKYPTNINVKTTSNVILRQYPSTSYSSLGTIVSDTILQATAVYKNASGEYWYQIVNNDHTGYIRSDLVSPAGFRYDDLAVIEPYMANNISVGSACSIKGQMVSQYNDMYKVYAKVFSGENVLGTAKISGNATVNGKAYDLYASTVDYALTFGGLSTGYYTYEISADIKSYYVSNGSLTSKTENVALWKVPFTVGSPTITPPAAAACEHTAVTDAAKAPTCTATGLTAGSHCSKCGQVLTAQTVVPATGHRYTTTVTPATCTDHAVYHFSCKGCSDTFDKRADELTEWTVLPDLASSSPFESKTQYRYSDYQTQTSYSTSLAGYTQKSSTWVQSGTGTVNYVKVWPTGFSTSNSLYSQYNNQSKKVTASETATTKTTINSDAKAGYLWYHWCAGGAYSSSTQSSTYSTFHAFYSTSMTPDNADKYDSSDGSYKLSGSTACSSCVWYWPVEVYAQKYTNYKKQFTYERWTDFTAWSDTAVTASSTRKVETRTVYRLAEATLDHTPVTDPYVAPTCIKTGLTEGSHCSTCGTVLTAQQTIPTTSHSYSVATCTAPAICSGCGATQGTALGHRYEGGICTRCGEEEPDQCYYLFGIINGTNYGYDGTGFDHQFVDGRFVMKFAQASYVGIKSNDTMYMTNGDLGTTVTSAVLYDSTILDGNGDLLYVPKGREVTFTLVEKEDGTLPLRYVAAPCQHTDHSVNGICYDCGIIVSHTYVGGVCSCGAICTHSWADGTCTNCGMACPHSWANGICADCGAVCEHTFADGVCSICGITMTIPTLQPANFSLSFEGKILYNIYFTATDLGSVTAADMGLLTWTTPPIEGTIHNAQDIIPGAQFDGTKYMVQTDGIAAKYLGDTIQFRIYAKLADGSYAYSKMYSVNAKSYALGRINNSTDPYMRSLCVALLNYGAEAQKFFNYKSYDLMNASLTAEQQALVNSYDETMIDPVVAADSSKAGPFILNKAGFTSLSPTVSFDGAFSINYYFTTSLPADDGMTLYYWTASDYAAASVLSPNNATGSMAMAPTDVENQFWGNVADIAAKELDQTIYVSAVYSNDGFTYSTGVIAYHVGRYCEATAANANSAMQPLAAATATYGYYAKEYFKNLNG